MRALIRWFQGQFLRFRVAIRVRFVIAELIVPVFLACLEILPILLSGPGISHV